jgi:hypothetical protein
LRRISDIVMRMAVSSSEGLQYLLIRESSAQLVAWAESFA